MKIFPKYAAAIALLLSGLSATAGPRTEAVSPDGSLKLTVKLDGQGFAYSISRNGKSVVDLSRLGLTFTDGGFSEGVRAVAVTTRRIDEAYTLPVGKHLECRDFCNETRIVLKNKDGRRIDMVCRAYDDAVAFRYEFPAQDGWNGFSLKEEKWEIRLADDPDGIYMHMPGFINSHEGLYEHGKLSAMDENRLVDMPATFTRADGLNVAVTEAAVRKYAGMMLIRKGGVLQGILSPRLDIPEVAVVVGEFPHKTPWRVFQITPRAGQLLESDILTSLNDPCEIGDVSWLKPGIKSTFSWWNGNMVSDTVQFSPGNNFETNKYYIDFCARNGINLHDIYGYAETPWYKDSNFNFGWPGDDADPSKPIRTLDMQRIGDYAKSQGLDGLHVWVHWLALYRHLEEAFTAFEKWGVKGMMVDFMDRDDQQMIEIQEEILQAAARHHLFIQFHGACKPSGLVRTYPNEFTREGTLNYENLKWNALVTADHDLDIAFTRNLAGPADYHMGGFRSKTRDAFRHQYVNPYVLSTRSHMLGMYIVLENYLNLFCDTPMAYEHKPEFEFMTTLPYGWHEVKVLDGRLRQYLAVARRSGDEWWVGAINNRDPRSIEIDFSFLDKGTEYNMEMYYDGAHSNVDPNFTQHLVQKVDSESRITVPMAMDGGFAIKITK
ncbi:MAG: glycoside hydrolase family 97 protein [Bacteroidales bacterium]|nr:glycoside hydrolase family 97 protein [Bacteroidales bacterium]